MAPHLEGLIIPLSPEKTPPGSDPLMNKYTKYDDFQDHYLNKINSNKTHCGRKWFIPEESGRNWNKVKDTTRINV